MPLRQLTSIERQRIKRLTAESVDITLLQPTWTALNKGYMDATASLRNYLKENSLHDFDGQGRGAHENGIKLKAFLVSEKGQVGASASLYKPNAKPTKDGDPRIWFSKLHHYTSPDDMLAVTEHDSGLIVINLTQVDVAHVLDVQKSGPLWEVICAINAEATSVSEELLRKLRMIAAGGYVPSIMDVHADTAIGRTLENALGISMNARREPDYKGIELKSYRRKTKSKENRKQLFSKVPNWEISKFDSMTDVLDAFGYFREGRDRLNCTVSATKVNTQGLTFQLDEKAGILNEVSPMTSHGVFASWYLSELRADLEKKHAETFWVAANVHHIGGQEHFEFTDVIHTRKPIGSQFDILVDQGEITMDHMMKRLDSGRAHERGPSFKIEAGSLDLLFPPSKAYALA